jgi:hypothetical protein
LSFFQDQLLIALQLSDLLSYEEAVALKDLTSETQQESKAMMHLTERSTKDAAAMKILTVITLIYLPTTIVFVRYDSLLYFISISIMLYVICRSKSIG